MGNFISYGVCKFLHKASSERGDSPRGGEMPVGQRGPLSTRGTSGAGGGVPMQPFFDALDALDESLGMCRGRCPHRPAGLSKRKSSLHNF